MDRAAWCAGGGGWGSQASLPASPTLAGLLRLTYPALSLLPHAFRDPQDTGSLPRGLVLLLTSCVWLLPLPSPASGHLLLPKFWRFRSPS